MTERVLCVNVGLPMPVPYRGDMISTGIFKQPVDGPVTIRTLGLEGDGQADLSVHGGEYKAVYLYSADDYAWWATELGHPVQHAEFGENLTVTGLRDHEVCVGDTLRVGAALLQVTMPREPCFKLGIRMGDHRFPARFREANRMGFYARVLDEGAVAAGDAVAFETRADGSLTIAEFHDTYVNRRDDEAALRRLGAVPVIEPSWADWVERRLAELGSAE